MPRIQSSNRLLSDLLLSFLNQLFRRWTTPAARPSVVCDSLIDLSRPKDQLIMGNASLRQPLVILQRHVKPPHFNRRDRFFLLFLASRWVHSKQALVLLQPETLLRWHRQGFRLLWRRKSKPKTAQPKIGREDTPYGKRPRYLIRDDDAKFGTLFDRVAKGTGPDTLKIPYRAPRANAICERFFGSVRREGLDHLLIFGDRQLHRVIVEYVRYFNRARPHQGIEQRFPEKIAASGKVKREGNIIAFPTLNGLHHDYRRAA